MSRRYQALSLMSKTIFDSAMKIYQALLFVFLLTSFSCYPAFKDVGEYAECHALEARQAQVEYTLEQAQVFANRVTDAEGEPMIRSIVSYPFLGEALGNPDAVSAYLGDTRSIFSIRDSIQYRHLVHELAHAVCGVSRCDGPLHGPKFVEMERRLFKTYPAR
jgi:hypothetical protein